MRKAFTMIELLTVMLIMALLGVAATGGYAALQRGMRERAAVAGASALLRSAKERAAVDRVPTAVFCYNKLLRDANAAADENAVVVGVMTAIRRSGRISYISGGNLLYDEFGDMEHAGNYTILSSDKEYSSDGQVHAPADLARSAGMRLWRFPNSEEMKYSIVAESIWVDTTQRETIFSDGASGGKTNCLMAAFYNLKESKSEPSWKVGDAYAFEIGETQLPHGFIFGSDVPTTVGEAKLVAAMLFDPEADADKSVEVWSTRPNAGGVPQKFRSAGRATSSEGENM